MFESIGRDPDPDRHRRSLAATVIAAAVVGAGLTIALSDWTDPRLTIPSAGAPSAPLVEVVLQDAVDRVEAPTAPPPPTSTERAPLGDDAVHAAAGEDEVLVTLDLSEATPVETTAMVDRARAQSTAVRRSSAAAEPEAAPSRVDPGVGYGAGGAAELRLKRQVEPAYPGFVARRALCRVTLTVEQTGRPADVFVSGCPTAFSTNTRSAIERWRWERHEHGPVQIELTIAFEPTL